MAEDIEKFKYQFGYDFTNKNLLREALTHRSYSVEHNLDYDNQRLEFLGDAVLQIILTDHLFRRYPNKAEGPLTKIRSAMARQETLAQLARQLDLGRFMLCGKGETGSNGAERNSTLSDLFEAIVGALYLDAGFEQVRRMVIDWIVNLADCDIEQTGWLNPKGALQEYSQRKWGKAPVYSVLSTSGPEHSPIYRVAVKINDEVIAEGSAAKRKQAESDAAKNAISILATQDKSIQGFLV